jgi:hypothetical protein
VSYAEVEVSCGRDKGRFNALDVDVGVRQKKPVQLATVRARHMDLT